METNFVVPTLYQSIHYEQTPLLDPFCIGALGKNLKLINLKHDNFDRLATVAGWNHLLS